MTEPPMNAKNDIEEKTICGLEDGQLRDSDGLMDMNQKVAFGIKRAVQTLHACSEKDTIIAVAINFLNVLKYLKAEQLVDVSEYEIFTPLMHALAQSNISIDLLAFLFAYCSVHSTLVSLVHNFIASQIRDKKSRELLRNMCQGSDRSYRPGFYEVIFKLEQFESVDLDVITFTNMNLGHVILDIWMPLWMQKRGMSLHDSLVCENLLFSTTMESHLDFHIATRCHNSSDWQDILRSDHDAARLFMYRVSRRAVRFPSNLPASFYELSINYLTSYAKNDSFKTSRNYQAFNFRVLMEVLDHQELNLLEEAYLVLLLNVSLQNLWQACDAGRIQDLHIELGKLGTTQTLSALVNLLQYLVCNFIISVGNVMLCARRHNENGTGTTWFTSRTRYQLPDYFDNIVPKISPISKSLFSFDENSIESELQANNSSEILNLLLSSLNLLLLINKSILDFYGENDVFIMDISSNDLQDDLQNSIDHKTASEYLELYHISNLSIILLSEQLLDADSLMIIVGEQEAGIQSRLLARNAYKCFESLILTHKEISLYHLIRFASKVSAVDLLLQQKCVQLLNHLLFHSNSHLVQEMCLINELSLQTLRRYIEIWNDGSPTYAPFFEELFKTKQVQVEKKKFTLRDILHLFPGLEDQTPPDSPNTVFPANTLITSATNSKTMKLKFNAYATSFVPANRSIPPVSNTVSNGHFAPLMPQLMNSSADFSANFENNSNVSNRLHIPNIYSSQQELNTFGAASGRILNSAPCSNMFDTTTPSVLSPSTWDTSCFSDARTPSVNINSSVVSTGKNYILGGHNRVTNNSRAQSVHVDVFENMQ